MTNSQNIATTAALALPAGLGVLLASRSHALTHEGAAISRAAAFLQKKRFVKSQQGFGRKLQFLLTQKGRELHDQIIHLALDREQALLTGLSKRDVDALIGYLHVLLKNLAIVEAIDPDDY